MIAAHTFKNVECSVKADFFSSKGMGQNKRSLGQTRGVKGEKSQFQEASKQSQSYAHCSKELQLLALKYSVTPPPPSPPPPKKVIKMLG